MSGDKLSLSIALQVLTATYLIHRSPSALATLVVVLVWVGRGEPSLSTQLIPSIKGLAIFQICLESSSYLGWPLMVWLLLFLPLRARTDVVALSISPCPHHAFSLFFSYACEYEYSRAVKELPPCSLCMVPRTLAPAF
ncbi:hypothetical protein AALP_AA5G186900 [Arabis alpina]|uniref:Uncharacterized protein n=1 Tax=Arabis alpina TaxID=50452 RepID=A0A087GXY8_ARAAL|nr:hypothetical protein AALP_AA5G186900 [Arabis alpina]